jgi:hypothetical protein
MTMGMLVGAFYPTPLCQRLPHGLISGGVSFPSAGSAAG